MCYIPFSTYLSFSAVALVLYYILVAVICYRDKLFKKLRDVEDDAAQVDDSDSVLCGIASSLHALIAQAAVQQTDKAEALHFVRQLLGKYANVFTPAYRDQLEPLIVKSFHRKLKTSLNEAEVNSLWPAI